MPYTSIEITVDEFLDRARRTTCIVNRLSWPAELAARFPARCYAPHSRVWVHKPSHQHPPRRKPALPKRRPKQLRRASAWTGRRQRDMLLPF